MSFKRAYLATLLARAKRWLLLGGSYKTRSGKAIASLLPRRFTLPNNRGSRAWSSQRRGNCFFRGEERRSPFIGIGVRLLFKRLSSSSSPAKGTHSTVFPTLKTEKEVGEGESNCGCVSLRGRLWWWRWSWDSARFHINLPPALWRSQKKSLQT